jgi:hypothetical protein
VQGPAPGPPSAQAKTRGMTHQFLPQLISYIDHKSVTILKYDSAIMPHMENSKFQSNCNPGLFAHHIAQSVTFSPALSAFSLQRLHKK